MNLSQVIIDREALRLCNLGMPAATQVRFLSSLNPGAQEEYRRRAIENLKQFGEPK